MLPIPNSNVFRSRRKALWYSFWVVVTALLTVPFAPRGTSTPVANNTASATDAAGEALNQADLQVIADAVKSD